jgi:hypothetical protein
MGPVRSKHVGVTTRKEHKEISQNTLIVIYRQHIDKMDPIKPGASLALREVSEHRARRGICRPWREKVIGRWRKQHNEELQNLYCNPNIRAIK